MCEKDFETLAVGYLTTRTVEKDINRAKSSERGTICTDL